MGVFLTRTPCDCKICHQFVIFLGKVPMKCVLVSRNGTSCKHQRCLWWTVHWREGGSRGESPFCNDDLLWYLLIFICNDDNLLVILSLSSCKVNYFKRKFGNHFERPYGWAWLLKLQAELEKNAQVNLTMQWLRLLKRIWQWLRPPRTIRQRWRWQFSDVEMKGNWTQLGGNPLSS